MLFRIIPSANNDRGADYVEPILNTAHEMNLRRAPIELGFSMFDRQVGLFCRVPPSLRRLILDTFTDSYPTCRVEQTNEAALAAPVGFVTHYATLRLTPDVFPLKTPDMFQDSLSRTLYDPVSSLLSAVRTGQGGRLRAVVTLRLQPVSERRYRQARRVVAVLQRRFLSEWQRDLYERLATHRSVVYRLLARSLSFFTVSGKEDVRDAEAKLQKHLFDTVITCEVTAPVDAKQKSLTKLTELMGAFGTFSSRRARFRIQHVGKVSRRRRFGSRQRGSLLSAGEISALWHPPTETVAVQRRQTAPFRELEPPLDLPHPNKEPQITRLGRVQFRRQKTVCGLRLDDRRRHTYIVGKSGMGKSTLLASMALSDIVAGHGVCFIDPHGDIVTHILDRIPKRRTNDVIYFDPSDTIAPIGFNPLHVRPGSHPERVADGVVSAFIKVFKLDQAITTRMLHILRNSVLTLVENRGSTLIGLQRLLVDSAYRTHLLDNVTNPAVCRFWSNEFDQWSDRQRTEYIASLQNKLGAFLTNETLQHVLGQQKTQLHLRALMDDRKILLVNLSKGTIGEEGSHFLGTLLTAQLQVAAMSRADIPEKERKDFMLYVDEFQHYATDTFASMFSESRKMRLSLTVANQYLGQLATESGPQIRDAVFGNVGSMVCFQVGPEDAELLALQLGGGVTAGDLMGLPNFHAYVRLLIDGMPHPPFVMSTLPPAVSQQRADIIRRVSRRTFGKRMDAVKADVRKAYGEKC